jgi:hypothetical protein
VVVTAGRSVARCMVKKGKSGSSENARTFEGANGAGEARPKRPLRAFPVPVASSGGRRFADESNQLPQIIMNTLALHAPAGAELPPCT